MIGDTTSKAQSTESDISARLVGKMLLLRGFWVDDNLNFDNAGLPVGKYRVGSFTESAFDAQKVRIEGDHLTIEGQRLAIVFTPDGTAERLPMRKSKAFGSSPEVIRITIDGHGNPDFGEELDVIFASTLREITPSLPVFWQAYAHKHFLPPAGSAGEDVPTKIAVGAGSKIPPSPPDVKGPKVIHSAEPKISDAARQQKFSGNVEVYLWVEPDGKPSHISIVRPVGVGLDEQAVAAVSQYQFAPATKNGIPVKVDLYINVNFQPF